MKREDRLAISAYPVPLSIYEFSEGKAVDEVLDGLTQVGVNFLVRNYALQELLIRLQTVSASSLQEFVVIHLIVPYYY
ncbi:hypothetical protein [Sodalis ligni]|uniref:hypothetical protein n=1 Tax=Sodalis ligni TaxID=2697027 RepID=UPI0020969587|nr:hypothetical protein [Sodalis ligni]